MYRFIKDFVFTYWAYYLAGLVALSLTNYIATIIPLKLQLVIDNLTISQSFEPIKQALTQIIYLAIALAVARTASRLLIFFPGRFVEYDIRNHLFKKLLSLSHPFFQKEKIGDLISRMINDIQSLRATAALGYLHIINTLMIYTFVIYQMKSINPNLTLWILLPIPLAMGFISFFVRYMYRYTYQCQQALGDITNFFVEVFNSIKTIKTTTAEPNMITFFNSKNQHYFAKNIQLAKIRSIMFPFIGCIGSFGSFVLLLKGGPLIVNQQLSIGQFVALSSYIALLGWPTASLAWIINIIQRGKAAWSRIETILNTNPDFTGSLPLDKKVKSLTLTLNKLIFSYENSAVPSLNNVNLTITSGQTIGIFGPSGSGKSTLLSILSGLEKPMENQFKINNQCIHNLNIQDYHEKVAYVSQKPFLFSKSIASNIGFSNNQESIKAVAHKAAVDHDIRQFSNQYDTIVGEKGVILSGGQQSRVALARALYKNSPILILDDVLSALDHDTEAQVLRNLMKQKQPNQIIIIVSHRISSFTQCDNIYCLESGHIHQTGTHNDLITRDGRYKHTWNYQNMVKQ